MMGQSGYRHDSRSVKRLAIVETTGAVAAALGCIACGSEVQQHMSGKFTVMLDRSSLIELIIVFFIHYQ